MTILGELLKDTPEATAPVVRRRFRAPAEPDAKLQFVTAPSIRDEQIHSLVQQLFFRHPHGPVRRVGFAPLEEPAQHARLCLEVVRVLVDEGKYDVGLIDGTVDASPLHAQLQISLPQGGQARRAIAPRLWLVARDSWYQRGGLPPTEMNLERLRELAAEFDFSVVHCPRVSWLAARIGHCCDGLVLVLTANKTRRLVAAQVNEQLRKAQVNVLGTVLTERRFPIPSSLYRSL